ncbi:MAG: hypothetical protein WDW20_01435 [Neisseriaceae bacterium]
MMNKKLFILLTATLLAPAFYADAGIIGKIKEKIEKGREEIEQKINEAEAKAKDLAKERSRRELREALNQNCLHLSIGEDFFLCPPTITPNILDNAIDKL